MATRSFEDSSGILWEVFEVRRTSGAPGGVSHGLEKGWLAFVSSEGKRRLAPFPAEWDLADVSELERLCATARTANPPRFDQSKPRIRPPRATSAAPTLPAPPDPSSETGHVRDVVRKGLEQSRGNYKIVARMFNMDESEYKRFLNFLRKHDCQLPFKDSRQ